ncbi:hypothetical protein AB0M34_11640 [Nocardia sp. NPDC050193]
MVTAEKTTWRGWARIGPGALICLGCCPPPLLVAAGFGSGGILAARKTIHRRYHDPDDDASLADLAEEYSVCRQHHLPTTDGRRR